MKEESVQNENAESTNEVDSTINELTTSETTPEQTPIEETTVAPEVSAEVVPSTETVIENATEDVVNDLPIEEVPAEAVVETEAVAEELAEPIVEIAQSAETVVAVESNEDDEEAPEDDEDDEEEENPERVTEATFIKEEDDIAEFTKKDLVDLSGKLVDSISKSSIVASDVKNIDNVAKQIQIVFDEITLKEKSEALAEYQQETGSAEGFEFKNDNLTLRFEAAMVQIKDSKNAFYRKARQLKDDYFEVKTNLLEKLRIVVEEEEKGGSKENWNAFKQIQEEWRDAGNVNSPHNGSLWSAYNALVDRYYNIRNIQNELKDLDRKKNLEAKTDLSVKISEIAETVKTAGYSNSLLKQANEYFEEYKALGPAPREEQEALWATVKAAFDVIYEKKREQGEVNKQLQNEVLEVKVRLVESLKPFLDFDSGSINEWNAKTKEVLAVQEQWNEIKGGMPRNEGKTVTKDFWSSIKQFFKNKSTFFEKLEEERKANLVLKEQLCQEIEGYVEAETTDAAETNRVIEMQKTWRTIGHVPHKQKDSIYKRFKKAADAFFNLKRSGNAEVEAQYEENLKAKQAICEQVEKLTEAKEIDLTKLSVFKNDFNKIGFVPRKNIKTIQDRFIKAINDYVRASSTISPKDEEKLLLRNQVEVELKSGGSSKALDKKENDISRKAKALEDDIALWRNNIEFFGPSKGAEKMKAEFEKKIVKAEQELASLNDKLKLFASVSNS
ncbi:MAG: DUF349 domain-containing protein [Spirosomaceae bacterium]|nr:DUF349 domain-containing protein [Spirosomataceae bacterium]